MRKASMNLTGSGLPETLGAARVSAGLFDTLGITPLRGRWFQSSEEKRGGPDVAIISAHLWRQRFSSDPQIVGKKIVLDGVPHEIVGVTRPDVPLLPRSTVAPAIDLRKNRHLPAAPIHGGAGAGAWQTGFLLIARLKPGVTPASAAPAHGSLASFGMWNFAPGATGPSFSRCSRLVGETSEAYGCYCSPSGSAPDCLRQRGKPQSRRTCGERGNSPFAWLLAQAGAI
jgi:hypothetical protein